jgi:large subunit ribosomal protein L22
MEVKAKLSFVRITPRKIGLLADAVRGKPINEALTYLRLSPRKRTATILRDLIKSAVANADNKGTVDVDTLYVKTILIGKGPTLKRFITRAKGSASAIKKRTSHVFVTLAEK